MNLPVKRLNFFDDFFEKQKIPGIYSRNADLYRGYLEKNELSEDTSKSPLTIVNCIPPYLGIGRDNLVEQLNCIESNHLLGFAIDLSGISSISEFLRKQLGKKGFKQLRQSRNKLEREHDVKQVIFHGEIDYDTCHLIMDVLKGFVAIRFQGRLHKHASYNRWKEYQESVPILVNKGLASLFVFYIDEKPAVIGLNYHFADILYPAIISFDERYKRYGPGRQILFKLIEWCYENNFKFIEMGWGLLEYKIKFSNAVYAYNTHVVYPKNKPGFKLVAILIKYLLKWKNYLDMIRYLKRIAPYKTYKDRWLSDSYRVDIASTTKNRFTAETKS